MTEDAVDLNEVQRGKVEKVCREHAAIRGWELHAVNARTNHVHLVVTADKSPRVVRNQFKANATRVLRERPGAIAQDHVWTRGGDCEIVDGEENLARVIQYVNEAQDRMDKEK
jgi:REP element-mobilizing transposase RayT